MHNFSQIRLTIIHDRFPIARKFPGHGCDHRSMTSKPKAALISKLRGSLMCLAYFFDMLSMWMCTNRHWQTSGRLVQELNVCTVMCSIGSQIVASNHGIFPGPRLSCLQGIWNFDYPHFFLQPCVEVVTSQLKMDEETQQKSPPKRSNWPWHGFVPCAGTRDSAQSVAMPLVDHSAIRACP